MFTNRTFGVEIEFFGTTGNLVAEKLEAMGIAVQVERYNHVTRRHWKITTDSSVTAKGTGAGSGLEIVSPILSGTEGLEELKKVLQALNEAGAKVDKSCGIHVHHNASDFTGKTFVNVYGIYAKYEETIDSLFPVSRRGNNNTYCRSLKGNFIDLVDLKAIKTPEDALNFYSSRYHKVNCQSYRAHGTIEFRQHSGSTEYEKISAWIILTQAIVERAINMKNRTIQLDRENICTTWDNFKLMVRMTPQYNADETQLQAIKYLTQRRKELAKKVA